MCRGQRIQCPGAGAAKQASGAPIHVGLLKRKQLSGPFAGWAWLIPFLACQVRPMTHDFMKMALDTLGWRVRPYHSCPLVEASFDLVHVGSHVDMVQLARSWLWVLDRIHKTNDKAGSLIRCTGIASKLSCRQECIRQARDECRVADGHCMFSGGLNTRCALVIGDQSEGDGAGGQYVPCARAHVRQGGGRGRG